MFSTKLSKLNHLISSHLSFSILEGIQKKSSIYKTKYSLSHLSSLCCIILLNKIFSSEIIIHNSSFNSLIAQLVIDSHCSSLPHGSHRNQFIQGVFFLFNNNILLSFSIIVTTATGKLVCIIFLD